MFDLLIWLFYSLKNLIKFFMNKYLDLEYETPQIV